MGCIELSPSHLSARTALLRRRVGARGRSIYAQPRIRIILGRNLDLTFQITQRSGATHAFPSISGANTKQCLLESGRKGIVPLVVFHEVPLMLACMRYAPARWPSSLICVLTWPPPPRRGYPCWPVVRPRSKLGGGSLMKLETSLDDIRLLNTPCPL